MWEALDKAAYYRLDSLTAIVDVNRLGQRGPTELGWDLDAFAARAEGFGCHAITIDGHDLNEIDKALAHATQADRPTVILARTRKGRGSPRSKTAKAGTAGRSRRRWPIGPSPSSAGNATLWSAARGRRADRSRPGPAARWACLLPARLCRPDRGSRPRSSQRLTHALASRRRRRHDPTQQTPPPTSAPTHHPAHGAGPTTMPAAVGNSVANNGPRPTGATGGRVTS